MGLGPRIDIRQSQSLVLTPQLTQAIKLLQLSNLELEAYIAEEMSKNPLIEDVGGEDAGETPAVTPVVVDAESAGEGDGAGLRGERGPANVQPPAPVPGAVPGRAGAGGGGSDW